MSKNPRINAVSSGLSLIELMVAITLGLLLTAGMIQLFNSTKLTFQTTDAISRVQENGRFALETLKKQLRDAGTLGFCAGQIEVRNHLNTGCGGGIDDFFDPNRALVGWEYDGTGPGENYVLVDDLDPASASNGDWDSSANSADLPAQLGGLVVPGSDVLVVRRMDPLPGVAADDGPPPNNENQASINLVGSHGLPDDSLVLVTNCSFADLFQNRSNASAGTFSTGSGSCANPGPGNQSISDVPWSTSYGSDMQALGVSQVAYFIGVRRDGAGDPILGVDGLPITGLYRWNMSSGIVGARAEEIVEGVDNMQILYGFSRRSPDGDGQSVNDWLTADQVPAAGWQQVLAVRVALSVRSQERADLDQSTIVFDLAGTQVSVDGDGRIRQPFTTTVALRNRIIVL